MFRCHYAAEGRIFTRDVIFYGFTSVSKSKKQKILKKIINNNKTTAASSSPSPPPMSAPSEIRRHITLDLTAVTRAAAPTRGAQRKQRGLNS